MYVLKNQCFTKIDNTAAAGPIEGVYLILNGTKNLNHVYAWENLKIVFTAKKKQTN